MDISLIAAMDLGRVIGRGNALPWRLPSDLKRFRTITRGHTVLMGRKTFESIGRPLPERRNIVLTRDAGLRAPGCEVAHSLEAALALAANDGELMVLGGAQLFADALPTATRMYLTIVEGRFEGDAHFPAFDLEPWLQRLHEDCAADENNAWPTHFYELERAAHGGADARSEPLGPWLRAVAT